jgi:quinohemoprotein ethanol dehydrogenase
MKAHAWTFRIAALAACLIASGGMRAADVDGARIVAADKEPQNWLSNGRTYSEQRFSPLDKINAANVAQLGLAWSHDIKSRTARGLEATPIVVDGVIYTSGAWSHVLALEAKTGKLLWEFDPQIPRRLCRQGLLRRGQPRGRGVGRQGLHRRL